MGNEERERCLAWLESKENCVFDFKKEMLDYCRSDVDERGKPKWTGVVDPFDSVTIASVCMKTA